MLALMTGPLAISALSGFGFIATQVGGSAQAGATIDAQREMLGARMERGRAELERLDPARPIGPIDAFMEAEQTHPRWASTDGCTPSSITQDASRAFRRSYAELAAERARALHAIHLESKIADDATAPAELPESPAARR